MHAPIYWLVFHLAARARPLDDLHEIVEAWLARRAPPPLKRRLHAAVGSLDVCYASVRELPVVRPRTGFGAIVGAEELATLAQADRVLLARARPSASPDFDAIAALVVLGAAFAAETSGVAFDPQRRLLLPLDTAHEPPAADALELALRLGVPAVRSTSHGLRTEGLALFGLPELSLPELEPFERDAGAALLDAAARALLAHGLRTDFALPTTPDGLTLEVTLTPTSTPSLVEVWPRVPARALVPARLGGRRAPRRARPSFVRGALWRRARSRPAVRFRSGATRLTGAHRRSSWQPAST